MTRIVRSNRVGIVLWFLVSACGKSEPLPPSSPSATETDLTLVHGSTMAHDATTAEAQFAADRSAMDAKADEDLDLHGFDADVIEHALYGRARARMFEDVSADKGWSVDLARSELKIGEETYAVQILGTYSNESETFLWAWANEGKDEWGKSVAIADALHRRAALPGQSVFRERKIAEAWVDPFELVYVAGEVAGGYPVFLARHEGGIAFLLVTNAKIDPAKVSIAYLPGVILDMSPRIKGDRRACIRRLATRLGFQVREDEHKVSGTRADGTFDAEFDDAGRVVNVVFDAGGHAQTRSPAPSDAAP